MNEFRIEILMRNALVAGAPLDYTLLADRVSAACTGQRRAVYLLTGLELASTAEIDDLLSLIAARDGLGVPVLNRMKTADKLFGLKSGFDHALVHIRKPEEGLPLLLRELKEHSRSGLVHCRIFMDNADTGSLIDLAGQLLDMKGCLVRFVREKAAGLQDSHPVGAISEIRKLMQKRLTESPELRPLSFSGFLPDPPNGNCWPEELNEQCGYRHNGKLCSSGISGLFVSPDGHVYRNRCLQNWLGTLQDFRLPDVPVLCEQAHCLHPSDADIPKTGVTYLDPGSLIPESPVRDLCIGHEKIENNDAMAVNWNLGNKCNFRCTYCSETLNGGSVDWLDAEEICRVGSDIISHYRPKGKRIIFTFTGGEVTLFRDLPRVLEYFRSQGCQTEILSNGGTGLASWEKIRNHLDRVALSFHPEKADPEYFIQLIRYLSGSIQLHINIMMHPGHFEKSRTTGLRIASECVNLTLSYQPLLEQLENNAKMYDYTPEQMSQIEELNWSAPFILNSQDYRSRMIHYQSDGNSRVEKGENYTITGKNHWKGWLCWTGLDQLIITQNREIYRAWCLQDRIGVIGNPLKFPDHPVICERSKCHCLMDMLNRKQVLLQVGPV